MCTESKPKEGIKQKMKLIAIEKSRSTYTEAAENENQNRSVYSKCHMIGRESEKGEQNKTME